VRKLFRCNILAKQAPAKPLYLLDLLVKYPQGEGEGPRRTRKFKKSPLLAIQIEMKWSLEENINDID
jgi:hypothetical protein